MSIRLPVVVFLCMTMAMSLVWSKALLSITMGLMAILAITDIRINPFSLKLIFTPSEIKKSIQLKPYMWSFTLFALLYIVSIVYAGDAGEWWQLTHPKLAFFVLPICLAMSRSITRKEYMLIMLCMIITTVWGSIWVQVAYYSHYELFNKSLGYGASLPTPGSHIRFSVITAISLILCLGFAIENWKIRYKWERWAYGLTAIYLFYFLHILSVRSGLVLAYAGIIILTFFYIRRLKVWKQVVLIAAVIAAPIVAYTTLPGFQLKVNYSLYDLGKFKEGQGDDYSDSQRWLSWQVGLSLGNQHPFFGTGTGKFRSELTNYYKSALKDFIWRPQNQWINVFAMFGLLGLIVFSFVIIYPMTFSVFWSIPMLPTIFIMQLISMLVEHSLDSEVGALLFLMLTLLGLSYQVGMKQELTEKQLSGV